MNEIDRDDVERIAKVLQKVQWGNLHLWDELHESVKRQWRLLAAAAIEEVILVITTRKVIGDNNIEEGDKND